MPSINIGRFGCIFALAIVLGGCEPKKGKELERVELGSPALTLRVVRYAEGRIGNAAHGEHYGVFCKSPMTEKYISVGVEPGWKEIDQFYRVGSQKLGRLPVERIRIIDSQTAYGTIDRLFVTFDGCRTVSYWDERKLPEDMVIRFKIVDPLIEDVEVKQNGFIALSVNPEILVHKEKLRVISHDHGEYWEIEKHKK